MADDTTMQTGDDPADYTVEQVQAHLDGADDTERQRVLDAERAGQARVGIVGHDDDPAHNDAETGDGRSSTRGQTFAEAADAATPDERGYLGHSPEAERTGRRDKGLSQRNPAVMQGGPLPDPRPSVDDTEGLAALKGDQPTDGEG